MTKKVYVSITGLQVKRFWHYPKFWKLAQASMVQANAADGCLSAEARTINGIHHTRSAWTNESAMRAFRHSGAHLEAMKAFRSIATGKTYGSFMTEMPDWHTVHELWRAHAKEYHEIID